MDEQQIIEETTQIAETVAPEVAEVAAVVRNNPVLLAGVGVAVLAVGATAGYFVAKKILTTKFEALLEDEIANAKEYYKRQNKAEEYSDPETALEAFIPDEEEREALRERARLARFRQESHTVDDEGDLVIAERHTEIEEVEVEEEAPKVHNIFRDGDPVEVGADTFDYDTEVAQRTEDAPYVITKEEFYENEPDFAQESVTYYGGDGVLADDGDAPIDDISGNVGEDNLDRFGAGSHDPRVVYVRNNKRGLDYEITLDDRSFAHVVAGLSDEDEALRRPVRRMRDSDD